MRFNEAPDRGIGRGDVARSQVLDGFATGLRQIVGVLSEVAEREQHFGSSDVTKLLNLVLRVGGRCSRGVVVRDEVAKIGEEGVGELVKNGKALALFETSAAVLNPGAAIRVKEDAAFGAYVMINFLASDAEEARKCERAEGGAFPSVAFGKGNRFAGQATDQFSGV